VRFAAVVAVVIAMHAIALRWLADALEGPARLAPMATPMFTRLLEPQAPVVVARSEAAAEPKPRRAAIRAVKPPRPAKRPASAASAPAEPPVAAASVPAEPASAPEVPASAPAPAPLPDTVASASAAPVASAPAPAASAPASAASAPAAPASTPIVIAADTWPADTRLSYALTGWYDGALTGSARVQWQRQQDKYETRVDLDLGLFAMQFLSQGQVAGESLAPRSYQESRPGRTRTVQFGADEVVLNDGRKVLKPPGVQDTASHFVELSHRFSTGREKLEIGGTTSVWLARPGGVDLWTYDIVGVDRLDTPRFGALDAYHLKPRPVHDARGDIYAEIWIAPTLQYLPVRIRITQGNRFVDILVDHIEQR
jgi:hypothetical protein